MTTYTMVTFENYDPTWAVAADDPMSSLPANFGLQNKYNTGIRFDPVRRKFLYSVAIYDTNTQINSTGFTIWDGPGGSGPINNGSNYNARSSFTQWIAEAGIDTGTVTFHQCYDSTKVVPTGAGPWAQGTYNFTTNPANGDNIVLNGITWTFVTSGASGPQTNIKADILSTINQLSWDLNGSTDLALTPAFYNAGYTHPAGTTCLGITYRTGGTAGNAYTIAAGTYGGTPSGATLTGGDTASDGTWRRFVGAESDGGGNDPIMVDPRTGNIWQHTESDDFGCAVYFFRRSDNFAQIISPYQPPPGQFDHMELLGISDTWTYVRLEKANKTSFYTLTLTPRDLSSDIVTLDSIVLYAEFAYDPLWNGYYFREAFNHATSMFTYGGSVTGTRAFKLYRFDEPSAAPFGGPIVGGGFTDITPWGSSTGPNSNVAAYTVDGDLATPSTTLWNKYSLYYLPSTNELACINKLWAGDTSTGWSDPTLTRFDCTFVDITGATFNYHEGFVTGYMQADWTTTTDPMLAAWVVLGVRELDLYLGQNTYAFSGVDYTKRWFYFAVQPVVAGSWSYDATKYFTMMVQYEFSFASAPFPVQVVPETGWDTAYAAYGTTIGNTNVVYNSLGEFQPNVDVIGDNGIYDSTQNAFYWAATPAGATICNLTPGYLASRQGWIGSNHLTGPFLKLSFSAPPAPIILGDAYMIERMDNRIWEATEDVWCVDCGLTTTLAAPNADLTASSATGAGIPVSITMDVAGQGYSAGTTATILDPTGSGAVVGLTIASGMITGATVTGGTGYTDPQVEFSDPAQIGGLAQATVVLDNTVTFEASAAAFDSGMVGSVIRMGSGKATITAFNDSEHVTGNMTTPITGTIPNSGGVPAPAPAGEWSVAPMITTVGGLWHLIGFTVTGVADGAVIAPQVVAADGTITLGTPASLVTVGLPFTPQFQSLYLDGGNPTIQGQRKKVAAVTIRLDASGVDGIVGGSNQPDGAAQNPPVLDMTWTGMTPFKLRPDEGLPPYGGTVAPLWTGDVRQPIAGGFDRPGQVALQQNKPLPLNVIAIVPEFLEGDSAEQGYTQEPKQGQPRGRK